MQTVYKKGFTLIELLVVIAIIAILAGLLLPAVISVQKSGYKTRAKAEVKSLETAVNQYFAEYGKFPFNNGDDDDTTIQGKVTDKNTRTYGSIANANLIRVLRAIEGAGNTDHQNNPRRIVFLDVHDSSLVSNPSDPEYGCMIDPWNQQYIIAFDTDFDNSVTFKSGLNLDNDDVVQSKNVAVLSIGPDQEIGDDDDKYIMSWKN